MQPKRKKLGLIKISSYSGRRQAGIGMAKVRTLTGMARRISTCRKRRASLYSSVAQRQPLTGLYFKPGLYRLAAVFLLLIVIGLGAGLLMQGRHQGGQVLGMEEELEVALPDYYTGPVVFSRADNTLTITPLAGEAVRSQKSGYQTVYPQAYAHTDAVYTRGDYQIKEDLVFSRSGHPLNFSYRLAELENYQVEKDADGNLVFYDKVRLEKYNSRSLSRVFVLVRPFLTDALGNSSYQAVTMMLAADTLTISLDESWLKENFYPITLDPGIR